MKECPKCREFQNIVELWERLNKVANKFCLQELSQAGTDWEEFCEAMNKAKTGKQNENN